MRWYLLYPRRYYQWEISERRIMDKTSCPGKPELLIGKPIGMYHCEYCGAMVLAGLSHPTDEQIREQGDIPYCDLNKIEVDFSKICKDFPREEVTEYAFLPSGRIVVMTDAGDSLWFEADGTSPKGSFLVNFPKKENKNG